MPNRFKRWCYIFQRNYKRTGVSDAAVVLAYYTLLSIFPMLIVLGNLLKITDVKYYHLTNVLNIILPSRIYNAIRPMIYSSLINGSRRQLSFGLLVSVWSASRMIAAFQRNVNHAYGINRISTVSNRLISFGWTLFFILFIAILMALLGYGRILISYFKYPNFWGNLLKISQIPITLLCLFLIVNILYYWVPVVKTQLRYIWLGSLVVTVGLVILSKAFSLYVRYFSKSLSIYKALGTFILLMFWLYFLGMIFLLGAVLNATNQEYKKGVVEFRTTPQKLIMNSIHKSSRSDQ